MPRYSSGARTGPGSTILPVISLYGIAGIGGTLREIGLTNTTLTEVALKLVRLTSAGTPGAGLVEGKHEPESPPASCTAFTTHTAAPTLGDDLGYRAILGAAIGSGIIWTFGSKGLIIPAGAANGIGVIVASGTGQVLDADIVWDE
jgi:hypothetical protein